MDSPERILVVDDEPDLRNLVVFNLREAGFEPEGVGTGAEALAAVSRARPAVVVLDLMLPDVTGTEVCRAIRADATNSDIPVLMLTARGDEFDRLIGFEVGADDYVVKPFSVRELVFRVRALARRVDRVSSVGQGECFTWRGLEVDATAHRVLTDADEIILRRMEYDLLLLFLRNPGKLFSRQEILEQVWGVSQSNSRVIDTHVRRLRERLGPYGEAIETVHGFGYRLREQP